MRKNPYEVDPFLKRAVQIARRAIQKSPIGKDMLKMGDAMGIPTTIVVGQKEKDPASFTHSSLNLQPPERDIPSEGVVFLCQNQQLFHPELPHPVSIKEDSKRKKQK